MARRKGRALLAVAAIAALLSSQSAPPPPAPPAPPPAVPPAPPGPADSGSSAAETDAAASSSSSAGTSSTAKEAELQSTLGLLGSLGLGGSSTDGSGDLTSGDSSTADLAATLSGLSGLGTAAAATIAPVLTASMSDGAVALSWSPVPGAANYALLRGAAGAATVSVAAFEEERNTVGSKYSWTGLRSGSTYAFVVVPLVASGKASNVVRVAVVRAAETVASTAIALPTLPKLARLCASADSADGSAWIWALDAAGRGLSAYRRTATGWAKASLAYDPARDGKAIDFAARGPEAIVACAGAGGKVQVRYLKAALARTPASALVYEGPGFAYYLSSAPLGSGAMFCFGVDVNGASPGGAGARLLVPAASLKPTEVPVSTLARNLGVARAFAPGGKAAFLYFDMRFDGSTVDAAVIRARSGTGTSKAPLAFGAEERFLDGDEDAGGGDVLDAAVVGDAAGGVRGLWLVQRADGSCAVLGARGTSYAALGAKGAAIVASGAEGALPPDPPSGRPFAILAASGPRASLFAWNAPDGRAYACAADAATGALGVEYGLGPGAVDSVEATATGFLFTLRAADGSCQLREIR